MTHRMTLICSAVLLCGVSGSALAQDNGAANDTGNAGETANDTVTAEILAIPEWQTMFAGIEGWSVEDFIDEVDVWGAEGNEIGEVENLIFDSEGNVTSLIAEVGGLWELGDTHVSIPWDEVEVEFGPAMERVVVPVTEETIGDYSLFTDELLASFEAAGDITEVSGDGPGTVGTGPRAFRATDLLQDYVRIVDEETWRNYGYIEDVLVENGSIAAVLVRPDLAYGTPGAYPYPYYGFGYGWTPGSPYYDLPYTLPDIERLEPVEP